MTPVLMKFAVRWVVISVAVVTLISGLVFGVDGLIGCAVGGFLAGANFLGLAWGSSSLLDSTVAGQKKARIGLLLTVKVGIVGAAFYYAIVQMQVSPLPLAFGIGSAIFGLTAGLTRATSSPEGKAAMDAEEARIARELGDEDDDA